eukprot:COSAG05_NODE_1569_length_4530_cov_2.165877_2_plen_271_part_00
MVLVLCWKRREGPCLPSKTPDATQEKQDQSVFSRFWSKVTGSKQSAAGQSLSQLKGGAAAQLPATGPQDPRRYYRQGCDHFANSHFLRSREEFNKAIGALADQAGDLCTVIKRHANCRHSRVTKQMQSAISKNLVLQAHFNSVFSQSETLDTADVAKKFTQLATLFEIRNGASLQTDRLVGGATTGWCTHTCHCLVVTRSAFDLDLESLTALVESSGVSRESDTAIDEIMGKIKFTEIQEAIATIQKARSSQDAATLTQHISRTQAVRDS